MTITKREMLEGIREYMGNVVDEITMTVKGNDENIKVAEVIEFLNKEIELLNRKRNPSEKDLKKAKENKAIADWVLMHLQENKEKMFTGGELLEELPSELAEQKVSNARLVAIITKLVDSGNVKKQTIKKIVHYSLPTEGE